MKRTTKIELIAAVRVLNHLVGANPVAHQPGSFVLQGAYGGWQLQRIHPSGGNESVTTGFRTKREVLDLIHAIRYGIREGLGMTLTN
jgi:hypothetical protein